MEAERNGIMEYTNLGKTDIKISKLCVGCMSFGKAGTMHDRILNEKDSDIAYLEEIYVPHKIVGAIDKNPPQGVLLLDEKK